MSNPGGAKDGAAKEKKGLSTKALVLIILVTVLVCGTVLAAVLLLRRDEGPAVTPAPVGGLVMTEENAQDLNMEINDRIARGTFETFYSATWTFPDGASPASDFLMGNAPGNQFPFYFTLTLVGEDTPVFTSGLLPLGTQISEVTLDRDLPAGSYNSVANIHMVDDEGAEVPSNMGFAITLVIQN